MSDTFNFDIAKNVERIGDICIGDIISLKNKDYTIKHIS